MPVKFVFENPLFMAWMLIHQTFNAVSKCEEIVFPKAGLTPQQHAVLIAIKYINAPATPTDIARWVDRNVNSITLIVDRMEKDGLVKRARDLKDRRTLRLIMTEKGEEALARATVAGWNLVQEVLSVLSEDEMRTLVGLLERVRQKAFDYAHPGQVMEEVTRDEQKNMTQFLARVRRQKEEDQTSKKVDNMSS
ncbi:MAG: MarR family transcriptional regulator [Dehalococcoidales bacterium]|nr:MarR family transcriptional regulator [Dehalococcoidales bacterium]